MPLAQGFGEQNLCVIVSVNHDYILQLMVLTLDLPSEEYHEFDHVNPSLNDEFDTKIMIFYLFKFYDLPSKFLTFNIIV